MPFGAVRKTATGGATAGPTTGGFGGGTKGPRPKGKRSGALVGPRPAAKPAPKPGGMTTGHMPTMPTGGGVDLSDPSAPPEITGMTLEGAVDPAQKEYAQDYQSHLQDLKEGTTREAQVFESGLESDIEQQVAEAKRAAAAGGRQFDEESFRAELKKGQYKSQAEFELGSQRQMTEAMQGGLDIVKSPWESAMAEKGLSADTQKMLMDYALGRGGLKSEDKKTAVMQAGQAIDAYKAFMAMLGGSFSSSTSFA